MSRVVPVVPVTPVGPSRAGPLEARMAELTGRRVPFVKATVVRARRPASARPGDTALVLADGRIEGFVGGVCAEATVRVQALRTLRDGESLLLRISPEETADGTGEPVVEEGAVSVRNPCLSGGELEIFLEPLRPAPRVLVFGESPIARTLLDFGPALGYAISSVSGADALDTPGAEALAGTRAVVIASHGRDEERALLSAVRAGVPYVGLVASPRRGAAVLAGLAHELDEEQRARVRTPAGLWIGARTPGEIALSILAEVVQAVRLPTAAAEEARVGAPVTVTATDPVCGMEVAGSAATTPYSDAGGAGRQWFCRPSCREAYEKDPGRYTKARAAAETEAGTS
ncbi:XdhC family protein [Streptomyces sp. BH-SS-21]|uniref:XdhC family protein n=1 Tax=Streptomyces liliiviolaceus TaxID=2823109 RepID=A0A940Y9N2_9ACTN|nr:XdhC family protein [Streptomyces liliiviolaceus]MBQ0855150.1 XdhC family protein [Streptomyces liliiviolaceus]